MAAEGDGGLLRQSRSLVPPPPSLSMPAWRYDLHLYLDYGLHASVLHALLPALHAAFPFSRLTHSQLSPLQHLAVLMEGWEAGRWQLNGLSVLDVLEQQWDARRHCPRASEAASAPTAAAAEQPASRQADRERKRRRGSGAQTTQPTRAEHKEESQPTTEGGSFDTAARNTIAALDGSNDSPTTERRAAVASKSLLPLALFSERRAEYVVATRYSLTTSARAANPTVLQPHASALTHASALRSLLGAHRYEHLSDLQQSNIDHASGTVRFSLFLTEYDCYVPGLTFVFGVARLTRCALVSLHRLERRSPADTAAFLAKECVHEIGHLFSLHHCAVPCVMAYSTSVEEAQQKSARLCPSCVVRLQWMQRGVILKPAKQRQAHIGSVEAAAEAAALASYR